MDIWKIKKWQVYYSEHPHRRGLRVFYEHDVNPEVKRACKNFITWLRANYEFPVRVRLYIKSGERIRSQKGDLVCGTFLRMADRTEEPYAKIATGDYVELVEKRGQDNALAAYLWTIAHELTHYFQWLNDLDLTLIGEERQATNYANRILLEYSETRDHP